MFRQLLPNTNEIATVLAVTSNTVQTPIRQRTKRGLYSTTTPNISRDHAYVDNKQKRCRQAFGDRWCRVRVCMRLHVRWYDCCMRSKKNEKDRNQRRHSQHFGAGPTHGLRTSCTTRRRPHRYKSSWGHFGTRDFFSSFCVFSVKNKLNHVKFFYNSCRIPTF